MTNRTSSDKAAIAPAIGLRPRRKAQMLERISQAAASLFEVHGYTSVTMEQIGATAEVSKRTLYKYFSAKDAVLAYTLEAELARDLAGCEVSFDADASFRKNISALLSDSAKWCEEHPDYLLPYIRYKFATFQLEAANDGGLVQAWSALIALGQRNGEVDTKHPPEQLAIYFHYLYFGALMRWLTDPQLILRQEFDTVIELFSNGVHAGS